MDVLVAVSIEVGVQTAVKVDLCGELGAGKRGGFELVRVWLVVLLGDGVVNGQGISLGEALDHSAYHCLGLGQGEVLVLVSVLIEVDTGKEGESCTGVWWGTVDELERSCEFPIDLGGDLVGHAARVLDAVEPVVP